MPPFSIAGQAIGPQLPAYCIAEVGINHNGDLDLAKRMIDAAKAAGADAVKFQTFKSDEVCGDPLQTMTYRSQGREVTEPMLELFRRYEFSPAQWQALRDHCQAAGITFFSTPQNPSDLQLLLEIGVPALKVGSDDFTNLPLLRLYGDTGLPLILSCGMSDLSDVHQALEAAGWFAGKPIALLLCTSQYPTPPKDVHASKLTTLQSAFPGLLVGLSDHTEGPLAATVAAALGARIFEKHFTLDHNLPGPDHWFSEEPQGLATWISSIHQAVTVCGSPLVRPTAAELDMRILARRSVVALRDIGPGETLGVHNLGPRRPGGGLAPAMLDQIVGRKATRGIPRGQRLALGDMSV
jgi:N,N'-diacetyllegionaminate synthase